MFKQDVHEPSEMIRLLSPVIPDFEVGPINEQGYADYLWTTKEGEVKQLERKTWQELIGDPDRVEEQLGNHIRSGNYTIFCLEGVPLPLDDEGISTLKDLSLMKKDDRLIFGRREMHSSTRNYSSLVAKLYQFEQYCQVHFTTSLKTTALSLAAFYYNDQKGDENHTTFRRYIKTVQQSFNPQVQYLLNSFDGMGPVRAEAIIKECATYWNFLHSDPKELSNKVKGISEKTIIQWQRKVGRPDV
jgi:ERCC4-type nuclease